MSASRFNFRVWDGQIIYFGLNKDGLFFKGSDGSVTPVVRIATVSDNPPIMQSTGLTDQNGKEIFEGDIVRDVGTGELAVIQWEVDAWVCGLTARLLGDNTVEIIGNIYETPELLKDEK